jgi:hypothetical protein
MLSVLGSFIEWVNEVLPWTCYICGRQALENVLSLNTKWNLKVVLQVYGMMERTTSETDGDPRSTAS